MRQLFILALILLVSSCTLFSPDEITELPDKIPDQDPFSWKKIPESPNTGIFNFSYYTDIFHADFTYENQSQVHERSVFLSRLNIILDNYSEISVSWSKGDTLPDPSLQNANEVELRVRNYTIAAIGSDNNSEQFSGEANFTIKRDSTSSKWLIKRWRDKDSTGISFFNPNF